jgi:hypothetical protein
MYGAAVPAQFCTSAGGPTPGDRTSWVRQVAVAVVHDSSETSLVTYADVRACWLRRTFATVEARAALSALCAAAAAPARNVL